MGKINIGRVILGGIVAGIVGNVLGYLVDGMMLSSQWADVMKAMNKPEFTVQQLVAFEIVGLAYGILTVWLYAAMRSRFGAGPKTAIYAGLAAWAIGGLLPNVAFLSIMGLAPMGLTVATTAGAILESVIAALAGAALYKESAESGQTMAARA